MNKKIFISYHFNDKTYKGEVEKWLNEEGAEVISADENDLRPEGDNRIKGLIKEQISHSVLILILVGNDTHNRPWVNYEVAVARSLGITTYWVRLPNRNGAAPKEVRELKGIEFNRDAIVRACNA